ncbi:MAG TPA: DUF2332 family protein [Candidatus Tumulicola sp.]|nr:DUF2332 family protein [Candidatus Tumulicola sp.]
MPLNVDVPARLRDQARSRDAMGSPFYGALLESAADDFILRGPSYRVLSTPNVEKLSLLGIRFMAAVHYLALDDAEELRKHFPSTGGDVNAAAVWPVMQDVLSAREGDIRRLLHRVPQTNEGGKINAALRWILADFGGHGLTASNLRDRGERRAESTLGLVLL